MGKFIHISIRRNLLYLVNIIIFYYLRKVDLIIINTKFNFNDSLIFTLLMFFGEFFAGLAIQLYQTFFIKEEIANKNTNNKKNKINIITNNSSIDESNKRDLVLKCHLQSPVRAITRGQSAVFYDKDGNIMFGGRII